ncbi:hypothetical protein [Aporhodopirellula aestuarii]|uniref:Uncharacterized protein n=1 Tax=Aporhodopirellula aestuarii TaxID=2950107 RepID=A0ABT0UAP7_9BACT|nr:hypothetical protein [Aporhodopirellula aestuarii]MCM2373851.1 hypothetical protein [Aporhodopirellula aestuarii]
MRTVAFISLFVIACVLSGMYGALHNQISYTVSPEYFTKFKFHQFQIGEAIPDRMGAAIVGWQASWWMGIVIGIFLIPLGLLIRETTPYLFGTLRAFGVVVLTALSIGLVALAISFLVITPANVDPLTIRGREVTDPAAFLRAGTMHNFSYLGGFVGILTGAVSIFRRFLRAETGSAKLFPKCQPE